MITILPFNHYSHLSDDRLNQLSLDEYLDVQKPPKVCQITQFELQFLDEQLWGKEAWVKGMLRAKDYYNREDELKFINFHEDYN